MNDPKNISRAIIYFILSTAITWWFVDASPLYDSLRQKLLSTGIAGAKWCLQIAAAYFFLKSKRWGFIKNIGFTCLTGSIILLPYALLASFSDLNSNTFFVSSLLTAVVVMIGLYYWAVKRSGLSSKWFWGWIICLCLAITLQLTVVFSVIKF
jgi:hypothetical protein